MSVSLTSSKDLVANSILVIDKDKVINLKELFLSKLDAIKNVVGLPVATLDSLQKLAEAINSDANLFNNIMAAINLKSDLTDVNTQSDIILKNILNYDTIYVSTIKVKLKSDITYVDTSCESIIKRFQYSDSILAADVKLLNKAYKVDTYVTSEVNVALSILQAGIDNRVLINDVDINVKLKIHAISTDILKLQKVDASTLYDALELSFNNVKNKYIKT